MMRLLVYAANVKCAASFSFVLISTIGVRFRGIYMVADKTPSYVVNTSTN